MQFLDLQEINRAGRFIFKKDQNQFIFCRGILKWILGKYLLSDPKSIRFEYNATGKPTLLIRGKSKKCLHFNLSHTDGYAIIAISECSEVGIDVERTRLLSNFDFVLQSTLNYQEIKHIQSLNESDQYKAFFHYWTKKEAFLKGIGLGLDKALSDCNFGNWREAESSINHPYSQEDKWTVMTIIPRTSKQLGLTPSDSTQQMNEKESPLSTSKDDCKFASKSRFQDQLCLRPGLNMDRSSNYVAALAYRGHNYPIVHYNILL